MVRTVVVIAVALVIAMQVVRNAAVEALAVFHPELAVRFWRGHPSVEISEALVQVADAARARKPVDNATFAIIYDAAAKAPLAAEPFLVRGVQAQTSGDLRAAKIAFLNAQWRDPRSLPAAYFLANYYLSARRPIEALEQTALVARLAPGGTDVVAPFIAAYAETPSNWPRIRTLFRSQADLEDPVLAFLAREPTNADAILAIADATHRSPDSPWLGTLLETMVGAREYLRARAIWSSVSRADIGGGLVFDADFSSPAPPAPFNWSLTTSGVGLAERQPRKRLHVIFYGNEDGVLARQLLLLDPGPYRLRMQVAGVPVHPDALHWSVRCDKSQEAIATTDITEAARLGFGFTVPANCRAQWLELRGVSGDVAQQSDVIVTGLRLTHG